jgi:hypothetical protein
MSRKPVLTGLSPANQELFRRVLSNKTTQKLRSKPKSRRADAPEPETYVGQLLTGHEFKDAESGKKSREGAQRGGRRKPQRDIKMAVEFLSLKKRAPKISNSALKEKIGKKHSLSRSAAIDAINRGLKRLKNIVR